MKTFTQKELLSEGIWSGVKKIAGGIGKGIKTAARVADAAVGIVAPEVQRLYDTQQGPISHLRPLKDALTGDSAPVSDKKIPQHVVNSIRSGLQRQNYRMSFKPVKYFSYSTDLKKHVYGATVIGANNVEKLVYVDQKGNILNP